MSLSKKADDYIERFEPKREFMDAYWLSREVGELYSSGDDESALERALLIYPKLRFILENYSRYEFALNFVSGSERVLDAPCGTGYGAAILASAAARVYGIDVDKNVISAAEDKYDYHNLAFIVGDMMKCDLPKVDMVVCFEGLEHVTPGKKIIERFARALSDSGKLIISVPINEDMFGQEGPNPYHMERYDLEKFTSLLDAFFSNVLYFGTDVYGSVSGVQDAFNGLVAVCEV